MKISGIDNKFLQEHRDKIDYGRFLADMSIYYQQDVTDLGKDESDSFSKNLIVTSDSLRRYAPTLTQAIYYNKGIPLKQVLERYDYSFKSIDFRINEWIDLFEKINKRALRGKFIYSLNGTSLINRHLIADLIKLEDIFKIEYRYIPVFLSILIEKFGAKKVGEFLPKSYSNMFNQTLKELKHPLELVDRNETFCNVEYGEYNVKLKKVSPEIYKDVQYWIGNARTGVSSYFKNLIEEHLSNALLDVFYYVHILTVKEYEYLAPKLLDTKFQKHPIFDNYCAGLMLEKDGMKTNLLFASVPFLNGTLRKPIHAGGSVIFDNKMLSRSEINSLSDYTKQMFLNKKKLTTFATHCNARSNKDYIYQGIVSDKPNVWREKLISAYSK